MKTKLTISWVSQDHGYVGWAYAVREAEEESEGQEVDEWDYAPVASGAIPGDLPYNASLEDILAEAAEVCDEFVNLDPEHFAESEGTFALRSWVCVVLSGDGPDDDEIEEEGEEGLENLEIFHKNSNDFSIDDKETWMGERLRENLGDGPDEAEIKAEAEKLAGYYFWWCVPGCMPDSDAFGPYPTAEAAMQAAREQ